MCVINDLYIALIPSQLVIHTRHFDTHIYDFRNDFFGMMLSMEQRHDSCHPIGCTIVHFS